jgi:hypothetical protein
MVQIYSELLSLQYCMHKIFYQHKPQFKKKNSVKQHTVFAGFKQLSLTASSSVPVKNMG